MMAISMTMPHFNETSPPTSSILNLYQCIRQLYNYTALGSGQLATADFLNWRSSVHLVAAVTPIFPLHTIHHHV